MLSCVDIFGQHKDVRVWHRFAIIGHCRSLLWEEHTIPSLSKLFKRDANDRRDWLATFTLSLIWVRHQARENETRWMGKVAMLSNCMVQHWCDLRFQAQVWSNTGIIPTCARPRLRSSFFAYDALHVDWCRRWSMFNSMASWPGMELHSWIRRGQGRGTCTSHEARIICKTDNRLTNF